MITRPRATRHRRQPRHAHSSGVSSGSAVLWSLYSAHSLPLTRALLLLRHRETRRRVRPRGLALAATGCRGIPGASSPSPRPIYPPVAGLALACSSSSARVWSSRVVGTASSSPSCCSRRRAHGPLARRSLSTGALGVHGGPRPRSWAGPGSGRTWPWATSPACSWRLWSSSSGALANQFHLAEPWAHVGVTTRARPRWTVLATLVAATPSRPRPSPSGATHPASGVARPHADAVAHGPVPARGRRLPRVCRTRRVPALFWAHRARDRRGHRSPVAGRRRPPDGCGSAPDCWCRAHLHGRRGSDALTQCHRWAFALSP